MFPIGFVLLVNPFNKIEQAERLIGTLNRMFDFPPIACHLDLGKNPQRFRDCLANVQFVHPHVDTKWADFSCIEAAVAAIRLLYANADGPEWFVYLSGADHPIKSASRILTDLQSSGYDAFIEHTLISRNPPPYLPDEQRPEGYKGPSWTRSCNRRYRSVPITIPWVTRRLSLTRRTVQIENRYVVSAALPFSRNLRCFAGEAWFCANHRAARSILDFHERESAVLRHYESVLCPEESYFQTILANDPKLRLNQNPLRYVDWTGGGNHPKLLSMSDLSHLSIKVAHFARKFPEQLSAEMNDALQTLIR